MSGCLAEGEEPDQPTLQFIRRITQDGVDKLALQSMCLGSLEKLTGPLNKFVQFSGLLSLEKALDVCDEILAWVAAPGHDLQWPGPRDYYTSIVADVYHIIVNSDDRGRRRLGAVEYGERSEMREKRFVSWVEGKIDQYAETAWAVAAELVHFVTQPASGRWGAGTNTTKELQQRLAKHLWKAFVEGERPLLDAVGRHRFAIYGFMVALRSRERYDESRAVFTQKLVQQAEADATHSLKGSVVILLVVCRHPLTKGECPVDAYEFSVDKERNEEALGMPVVIPALKRWAGIVLPDPVAQRAFVVLKKAYGIEGHP